MVAPLTTVSVTGFHDREIDVVVLVGLVRPDGTGGGVTSGVGVTVLVTVTVMVVDCLALPAASLAMTVRV